LARAEVLASPRSAREDVIIQRAATEFQPCQNAIAGLVGQFELHRLLGLPLDDGRAVAGRAVHDQLADHQSDQVAAPELAVDRQVEHGQVAKPLLPLEMKADGPDLLAFERRFRPDEAPFVPGYDQPRMWERNARFLASHSTSPEPREAAQGGMAPKRVAGSRTAVPRLLNALE
jgi:hypothetical protein